MADDKPEKAAEVAEARLGMSSLESHGASHMAGFICRRKCARLPDTVTRRTSLVTTR